MNGEIIGGEERGLYRLYICGVNGSGWIGFGLDYYFINLLI
jgi:hypothetical protein